MKPGVVFLWLLTIDALLAVGDLCAKKAVALPERNAVQTVLALAIWMAACCAWLPAMRARGFTKLIALANVIGLLMLAVIGFLFLGERLTVRDGVGIGFAVLAVLLLGG